MCRVLNVRRERPDVYIGRPSRWGNPFVIGPDGDRGKVIASYALRLRTLLQLEVERPDEPTLSALLGLHGRTLGCYCKPQACHGDVLLAAANAAHAALPDGEEAARQAAVAACERAIEAYLDSRAA